MAAAPWANRRFHVCWRSPSGGKDSRSALLPLGADGSMKDECCLQTRIARIITDCNSLAFMNGKPAHAAMPAALLWLLALPLAFSASAATPMPADSQYNVSLNGKWRFKLEQENGKSKRPATYGEKYPIELPAKFEAFYQTNYAEGGKWHDLNVPGNWEMAGYSPATYYQPDNASGFYRKKFVVPEAWRGRLVKVNFDGVQNGAEVWLNGQPADVTEPSWGRTNYHESGWTAWQADLTPCVKFGQENLLALRVSKNTRSVDCDSGDYFFLGGIYRPVTLFSVPPTHIEDFSVRTHLLEDGGAEVTTLVTLAGGAPDKLTVSVRLDGEAAVAGSPDAQGRVTLTQAVAHPRLWSAEFPNLYRYGHLPCRLRRGLN